ncbi:DUF2530 domain-containing protein [Parenemella sanctibonifatiensis]|nr:DUF2530 domain-containing protein [Parenemella sanctibonifatiensis]
MTSPDPARDAAPVEETPRTPGARGTEGQVAGSEVVTEEHDVLRPAPVDPVDTDGRLAFAIGTVCFAVGALVMWLLDQRDNTYICLLGVVIGLVGSLWTWRRSRRQTD